MKNLLIIAIVLIIIGMLGLVAVNISSFTTGDRAPFRGPGSALNDGFSGNGERIYFTGTSARDIITFSGGPFWFQMHGGGCATCHGQDGRGGTVGMMGGFTAPDITYKVLTGKVKGEEEHKPFTEREIKRAITRGIEPNGEELNFNMPRWNMADADLENIIDYLKKLDP